MLFTSQDLINFWSDSVGELDPLHPWRLWLGMVILPWLVLEDAAKHQPFTPLLRAPTACG